MDAIAPSLLGPGEESSNVKEARRPAPLPLVTWMDRGGT